MFQPPDPSRNLSLRLSRVLDEIGVNEDLVMRRRRAWMLVETINNIDFKVNDRGASVFKFGSQTEGSTTLGLRSDCDTLYNHDSIRVIADWSEWEPNRKQYLMVQDDTVSPGYCLLQAVRSDAKLPEQHIEDEHHSIDNCGRVLLRHSCVFEHVIVGDIIRHGPAATFHAQPGGYHRDYVSALHCSTWPKEADAWLQQQNASGWPTEDMKRYSAEQGCFVVAVASKTGVYQDLEWRISTSLAERCLMWNLNITQFRCYILLKMIIKTFLKPQCEETISSFMCKNILFQCVADSRASSEWNEGNLVTCVNQCLQALLNCILTEQCPHFIIPQNNLLAGKMSTEVKYKITEVMCKLTENIEQSLLTIEIDDIGNRLNETSGGMSGVDLIFKHDTAIHVAANNINRIVTNLSGYIKDTLKKVCENGDSVYQWFALTVYVYRLCQVNSVGIRLEQVASRLYTSFFCSHIGSVTASLEIHHSRVISCESIRWFYFGLNSDISSGKLKLASALYCAGDLGRCESFLAALKWELSQTTVLSACYCYILQKTVSVDFMNLCYEKNEDVIKHNMAFCVKYLPSEFNCIPGELKYEMFRSTEEDRPYRGEKDFWMDWVLVDSLPYLHFLQYKVYSQLHRPADQQQALDNLIRTIETEPNLGHRETALNLLGQCMEQENKHEEALRCYIRSLNVRARNNVAKWHVCILLSRIVNQMSAQN